MRIRLLILIVAALGSAQAKLSAQPGLQANRGETSPAISVYELEEKAAKAYDDKHYSESLKLYDQAFSHGLNRADDAYNAACVAALAGEHARAINYLKQAAQLGFRDPGHMKLDSDLVTLRGDKAFASAVGKAAGNERAYRRKHANPENASIVLSDIDLFWAAYDRMKDAPDREAVLEHEYLERGSAGLQDFVFSRIHSAADLLKTIDHAPRYYSALRPASLRIREMVPGMKVTFRKLKELYPRANFPDVYFLIGRMNSGGTTGPSGLLLGADMYGRQPGVSLAELSQWHQDVLMTVDDIPPVVAHELIHFQQETEGKTLLAQAIVEGSADFIGEMISGRKSMQNVYAYGMKHEAELWSDFSKEMNGEDFSHWMYQGKTVNGRPADLGYFIGYRISQAYYEKAGDKKKAIVDILNFKDASLLLKQSGYAERFSSPSS
jgi:hypothetical protein